jgi:hypothetical protein
MCYSDDHLSSLLIFHPDCVLTFASSSGQHVFSRTWRIVTQPGAAAPLDRNPQLLRQTCGTVSTPAVGARSQPEELRPANTLQVLQHTHVMPLQVQRSLGALHLKDVASF